MTTHASRTGRTANRPQFLEMMAGVRRKAFDVVVVEAVNRLSRRVVDSLQSWDLLTFSGVKLFSVSEGEQDFVRVMLNSLGAQMFSQKVADHTRRGLVGVLEREGRVHSLAYGYRKRETPPKIGVNREPDPETAPIVLRIFEEAAAGRSGDDIARGLNADGIPAPQGRHLVCLHDPRRLEVRLRAAAQDDLRRPRHLRPDRKPAASGDRRPAHCRFA